jgi:hypothetical protein
VDYAAEEGECEEEGDGWQEKCVFNMEGDGEGFEDEAEQD